MSGLVFPTLAGLGWNVVKTPIWSTKVQKAVSGKELRAQYYSQPQFKFSLTFDLLRDNVSAGTYNELQTLMGFFMQMKGQFDTFYYVDPTDHSVTDQIIGIGDGGTQIFPLTRSIGGYTGSVLVLNGGPSEVKVDGVPTTSYSVNFGNNTSSIGFTPAPAEGAVIKWTGTYCYNCRFLSDTSDFENFMRNRWQNKKLEFISIK